MRDVGDDADVKLASVHAMLRQPMRGGFQDAVRLPGLDHLGEVLLHVGRIGRGGVQARVITLARR